MPITQVRVARPQGGSTIADILKGFGGLGQQYARLKISEEERAARTAERKARAADRTEQAKLRKLQHKNAMTQAAEYQRKTAQEEATASGLEAVEGLNPALLKAATDGTEGLKPGEVGPSAALAGSDLSDAIESTTTMLPEVPGMVEGGAPLRQEKEFAPVKNILQSIRKANAPGEADVGQVEMTEEMNARLPEALRGLYPPGAMVKTSEVSKILAPEADEQEYEWDRFTGPDGVMYEQSKKTGATRPLSGVGRKPKKEDTEVSGEFVSQNPYLRPLIESGIMPTSEHGNVKPTSQWTDEERQRFYENLPPDIQNQAKQVAEYAAKITEVGRNKDARLAISAAAGYINPNYHSLNRISAERFAKTLPDLKQSANDAVADAGRVFELVEKVGKDWLGRTQFPWANRGAKWLKENLLGLGGPEKALGLTLTALAQEFATAENNGKVPGVDLVSRKLDLLLSYDDPDALRDAIREQIGLTTNRLVTKENQYEEYYGRVPDRSFLNEQTWKQAQKWGFDDVIRDTGIKVLPGERAVAPAEAAPGAPSAGAEESGLSPEGEPPGTRKMLNGKLVEWDGVGYALVTPEAAVSPGTGPLAGPQATPQIEDAMKFYR